MILAVTSSIALIHALKYIVVIGLILWLLIWFVAYTQLPEPFAKVARVIIALIGVIAVINLLLSLIGQPLWM